MMVAEKVDVSGSTVKVDNTDRLENLYTLARRATEARDWNAAHSYYKAILLEDPYSWEAVILTPCTRRDCLKKDLLENGVQVLHNIPDALELVKENVPAEQQIDAVRCIAHYCINYGSFIAANVASHLSYCFVNNITEPVDRWLNSYYVAADIQFNVGQFVLFHFGAVEDEYEELITRCIESAMNLLDEYVCSSPYLIGVSKKKAKEKIQKYAEKIKSYNAFYPVPEASSGCYVATAVYGSYDCPQVWTLRRFRDNMLATKWYGRAFIHIYYAISPTLVKCFGETKWFKRIWRKILNKLVSYLQSQGVESTPYQDTPW